MISFGREVCGDLAASTSREWLVTNGIGGYAMGTLAGMLTRSYHGLLVAALTPPLGRTLLLANLEETASWDGQSHPLFSSRWSSLSPGQEEAPDGVAWLERFHLEGAIPVWTFALADLLLEKRVWMQPGANITYIRYTLARPDRARAGFSARSLDLSLRAIVNYRDHHTLIRFASGLTLSPTPIPNGLRFAPQNQDPRLPLRSFDLLAPGAWVTPLQEWDIGYALPAEAARGQPAVEDHLAAARITARLEPGDSLLVAAACDPHPELDGALALAHRRAYEQRLISTALQRRPAQRPTRPEPFASAAQQLILAADQFLVRRASAPEPDGSTIIAGYPWFSDWGRDTMISLPGLTLATGRLQEARSILRTFAAYTSQGMLPNRFPDQGEVPEYNTADATLWYFAAIRAYHAASGDAQLLAELFPILGDIFRWHRRGTRYGIRLDPADGLLRAGEHGVQLTWMDARVGDWVVTPRTGKPVEINALWYNAQRIMADFAGLLGEDPEPYRSGAEQTRRGFARFWNEPLGYLFDVLDCPDGKPDPSLRPNQLIAVSLPYSPLDAARQRQVVDACCRRLLTSYGLRSLTPSEPGYIGHYGGDVRQRDSAYHQGTVWGWLTGPLVSAYLKAFGHDAQTLAQARTFLLPLLHHLNDHGVGNLSEIFCGDPPFTPEGCIAQAWTVAEVLRSLEEIEALETPGPPHPVRTAAPPP